MKTLTKLISILIILSSFGCNTQDETQVEVLQDNQSPILDFTKSFQGKIGDKYNINMTLTKSGEELSGTYTYKSQGVPLKISGTIDKNGNLTINEFNSKGSMTGVFKGQLDNDNTIIGHWSKPDGSVTMPFSISESSSTETSIVKTKKNNTDDYSNWTGIYIDKFERPLKVTGPASDGAVKFELTPQYSASCQEDVWTGTAYLTNSAVANYYDEESECHFNFTFNPGQVEVHEYNCNHGSSCGTFDGIYKKKK